MKICALIPARGGSKGIHLKNIKKVNNIPLINYSIKAAIESKLINETYLSTDNIKISNIAKKYNNKIKIIGRSKKTSTDQATTESLIDEFTKLYDYDILVLIQPTNVFVNSRYLNEGIKKIVEKKNDSLLSVVKAHKFLWSYNNKKFLPLNYKIGDRPRRQDSKEFFLENGSFYIFKRTNYLKTRNRLHFNIGQVVMKSESIFEIDDISDLNIVRKILKKN